MVSLSADAQQGIANIRQEVSAVAQSPDMSYDEMKVQLDGFCNDLAAIVGGDLGIDAPPCVSDGQQAA